MSIFRRSHACGFAIAAFAMVATIAHAASVRTDHVTAELVADRTSLVPGTTTTIALRLAIDRGWHTYWRNPGESGLPTTIAWRLPAGYAAGDIVWPAPKALPAGPLMNYGYEGEVLHLVPLTVPANAVVGDKAMLAARADWLVCKETCVPESAELSLELPVARDGGPSRWHDAIAATRAALPQPLPAAWHAEAKARGPHIALALTAPANARDPGALQFFAYDERRIEASAAQVREAPGAARYVLELPVSHELKGEFGALRGVLRAADGFTTDAGLVHAVTVDVPIAGTPVAGPKPVLDASATLAPTAPNAQGASVSAVAAALLFALAGGLLLNLMPCVFPILSIKALGLAAADGHDRRALRLEAVVFAAGVVVAFAALGMVLLALRAGGAQLGWGFQLQSPAVVTALAILFFVIAQNLSGVFEFGAWVPSGVATWTHANRHANAFASGLLAVAVASPCTAPFMGAALGYALTAPVAITLCVFVALGIGMALPYFLLAWFPRWRRVLPRPGPWLVRLRQILAFPLYATVAWLVWVLAAQVGTDAVLRIGLVLVLIALALFAWRAWRGAGRPAWSVASAVAVVAAAVVAWPLFVGAGQPDARRTEAIASGWQPYTPARVSELVDEGRPVFVDFTAAWCITCQVNERLVLNDARVRDAFAQNDVALVRADWTRRDPAITQALAELGRNGVPVYVIYRKGRPPQLLPEVLARDTVIGALAS